MSLAEQVQCACEGACDCTPWCYTVEEPRRGPVTMKLADDLESVGLWRLAEIAREVAVDRPRWWHRFRRPG